MSEDIHPPLVKRGETTTRRGHRRPVERNPRGNGEHLANLLDCSLDMIITVDRGRRITEFNRAAQQAFGYTPEEVLGCPVDLLYADPDEGLSVHETAVAQGRCIREIRNRRKNGEEFPSLLAASLLRDGAGNPVGVMGISRDISEQKLLERQLQQAQKVGSIGTLAGGIAHDFNNMLTGIIGYAELALTYEEPHTEIARYLDAIVDQGRRAASLTSQLLQFSRRAAAVRQPLELTPLVKETVKMLRRTLPENVTVHLVTPQEAMGVNADPTQIQQVVINLCINAAQAMPEGGDVTLTLQKVSLDEGDCRGHPSARPGEYVSLRIQDTGGGMPPEVQDRIFEPFFTTKEPGNGNGLGLAMVSRIVQSHEGHVTVASEVGQGSEFRVYLPQIEAPEPDASATPSPLPRGSETILLAEDDPCVLETGRSLLKYLGYTVLTAADGEEALELYRNHRHEIALVLTDLIMPKMGGQKLLHELTALEPRVRVLLMTGHDYAGNLPEFQATGFKGFVRKPFNLRDLADALRESLS